MAARPARHVPLIGDVAAGTGVIASESVEELLPLPEDFTGTGSLFMLRVRGDSMIEEGIFDGDFVVVRQQPDAENGDVVVAGISDEEGTVKTFSRPTRQGRPDSGELCAVADGARSCGGHDLRTRRHGPAPALIALLRQLRLRSCASEDAPQKMRLRRCASEDARQNESQAMRLPNVFLTPCSSLAETCSSAV